MMESYFKWKMIIDVYIPMIALAVVGVIMLILGVWLLFDFLKSYIRSKWIHHFFVNQGWYHTMIDVPSVGDGAMYGWVYDLNHCYRVAKDSELRRMKLSQIKKKYELTPEGK